MRAIEIDRYRNLIILTIPELLNLANVDRDDDDFVRDQKVEAYLHRKRARTILHQPSMDAEIKRAINDGIEILIIKENQA